MSFEEMHLLYVRAEGDDDEGPGIGPGGPDDPSRNPGRQDDEQEERETGILLKTRPKTKKPSMYKVLLLNDDFTPMEFVVHVLERFFSKTRQEATDVMLHVHRRGVGICGVFTFEVAEMKVAQVMDFARINEQPLQCTMEKE
jgi:ATP-dependent Clp protease adaptor protein ClpS